MNPACLFPGELQDKPWYYVKRPMTLIAGSKPLGTVIVCPCVLRTMAEAARTSPTHEAHSDCVVPVTMQYKKISATSVHTDQEMETLLGVGQCSYCGAIMWTCSDVETLIKICEQQGLD